MFEYESTAPVQALHIPVGLDAVNAYRADLAAQKLNARRVWNMG